MLYDALHQMLVLNKSKIPVKHQKYLIQYCQNCQIQFKVGHMYTCRHVYMCLLYFDTEY